MSDSAAEAFNLELTQKGVFSDSVNKNNSKVFVCGDCKDGQSLVVKAMADGRNCADLVDIFLNKEGL